MKNNITGWIAAALTASCFFACGGKEQPADLEALTWDSIVCDTTARLTDDQQSPMAEIHLNIKYADGKKAGAINDSLLTCGILTPDYLTLSEDKKMTVAQAVSYFTNNYIRDYQRDFGALYAKDKEHTASYNLQYSCNTHVEEQPSGVICYSAEVYNFAGGAHGMNITITKNFDLKTGKVMRLSDVFVPGYEEGLKELITKELCKKFSVKDLQGLQEKSIFVGMEPYVTENFLNFDDKVVFVYCDTEIAPHTVGEISIEIPKKQMKNLLKSEE